MLLFVALAERWNVAYPILLVLGGVGLGYIPGLPTLQLPPEAVFFIFLPPLLYWESVTAPVGELLSPSGLWWLLQLAFGLVVVTMLAVAAVSHALIPGLPWAAALVLGAIVGSTDEVAFAPIIERAPIPRHVIATIEGESLVNDATSLVLYGIAITALVTGSFSITHAAGSLAVSVLGGIAIGVAAGLVATAAWHVIKHDSLQSVVSLMTPYLAYLPAVYLGASGVLAAVAAGFTVSFSQPLVLTPSARLRITGFWVTIVFMLNAFIFVYVGMQFHSIVSSLKTTPVHIAEYGNAVAVTVIVVRIVWVFAQGLLPSTNEPEHTSGKPDWSHVAVLAWAGMRGGVSLAAALAIPIETAAGPFAHRNLIIFLTFCVLLVTLIGQGGSLPWLLRKLDVRDDGADVREERVALAATAHAALKDLDRRDNFPDMSRDLYAFLRQRYGNRWSEYSSSERDGEAARQALLYRNITRDLIQSQRRTLIKLRQQAKVDNTAFRRIQRLLDLEQEEIDIIDSTGRADIEE